MRSGLFHALRDGLVDFAESCGGVEVTDMAGYAVIVEQADDGGYGAWAPDLPGCVGLGDTIEECLADMKAAIGLYVDVLRERGDHVPEPRAVHAVSLPMG